MTRVWDPQQQKYVEEGEEGFELNPGGLIRVPAQPKKRRDLLFLAIGLTVAALVLLVALAAAWNVGEDEVRGPSPALGPVAPDPSPATVQGGDLSLSKQGVDNAAFSILYGYLRGGPEQAAFIVQDIQQRTGCEVVYGRIGTIVGVRAEFEKDTQRLEKRYGPMAGSALADGVGINIAFECP